MGRRRRIRHAAVAAVLVLVPALSGCVATHSFMPGPQADVIGDVPISFIVCASGSTGCPSLGLSGIPALSGTGQVLVGVSLQDDASLPSSLTSTGPEALTFTRSPSYAAELQRLDPAAPGFRWVGFISAATSYSTTSGPQSFPLTLRYTLARGADGGPFPGPLQGKQIFGTRIVSAAAPATRPVVCGPSLQALFDEDPSPASDVWVICSDYPTGFQMGVQDLGVLSGARSTGAPGVLAAMPFRLRYTGAANPLADFHLSATTGLAGATVAVTPEELTPKTDSTSSAVVAVGVPNGARPGNYDVTLTAKLANGQTRAAAGTLTVLAGPGGPGVGTGVPARLKLTAILPRRLSAKVARRRGIVVLIGATEPGPARVQLFQGHGRRPKASARVRLKVPGPTRVVLKSAALRKGRYRVVVAAGGRAFTARARLAA